MTKVNKENIDDKSYQMRRAKEALAIAKSQEQDKIRNGWIHKRINNNTVILVSPESSQESNRSVRVSR